MTDDKLLTLVRRAYIEGHRQGRADPPVYQSAEEDWQQSQSRRSLANKETEK